MVAADAVVVRHGADVTVAAGAVWSCAELTTLHPALAVHAQELSGVLVLHVTGTRDMVVWTRRERTAARTWATDPDRPVNLGPHGERLTPRGSSAVYREVVRGRSVPWTAADETVVDDFGRAVARHLARVTTHVASLNEDLRRANHDLDTFTHVAAHELKEPLRGIATTAWDGQNVEDPCAAEPTETTGAVA